MSKMYFFNPGICCLNLYFHFNRTVSLFVSLKTYSFPVGKKYHKFKKEKPFFTQFDVLYILNALWWFKISMEKKKSS